jgi:hypothetical protein
MSLMYPQKKMSMGVISGLCGNQLFSLPLQIHQPGNHLVHHLVRKWDHQLLCVGTQSFLAYPGKLHLWWYTRGRRAQQFILTCCCKHAPLGQWVLTATNPTIVAVSNNVSVKWPHQRKEFSGDNCHCSDCCCSINVTLLFRIYRKARCVAHIAAGMHIISISCAHHHAPYSLESDG